MLHHLAGGPRWGAVWTALWGLAILGPSHSHHEPAPELSALTSAKRSTLPTPLETSSRADVLCGRDASNEALGRRVLYFSAVIGTSLVAGMGLVVLETPLVFAALAAGVCAALVVRYPFIGLLAYVFIYATRLAELYPVLAPLRLERVVGMLTFIVLVLKQVQSHGRITFDASTQTRRFYFLILAAVLSIPFAFWRMGAWTGTVDLLKLLILYLMVVHLVDTRRKLRVLVILHIALIGFVALSSTVNYVHGALLHAQGIDRAVGATSMASGPNEMGATMATTIPILVFFVLRKRISPIARFVVLALLVLFLVTLVLTGSRSGLIGFLGAMTYLWWLSKHRILFAMLGIAIAAGGFFALPEQYQGRYATITQGSLDGSSQERLKVWTKGLHMFIARPITGVGIHNFGTANAEAFSGGGRQSWLESHSLYVQVPAEMGLVGVIAFFSFMFEFFRVNRRTDRKLSTDEEDWEFEIALLKGMFSGLIALLFTGIFGHSLMRDTWYVYAALALAISRIHTQLRDERERDLGEQIVR